MQDGKKTKIAASSLKEDPFYKGVITLSLRQGLTIMLSFMVWMVLLQVTGMVLPFSPIFCGLLWSWVFAGGIILALVTKNGRPLEELLSDWLLFTISDHYFVLMDPKAKYGNVEDAEYEEVDDDVPFRL